jgi:glycosyltransferase involved in cell wall biosynthesis
MKTPLLSIIIAIQNPGKKLGIALKSLLDQVDDEVEIILQDNESTDEYTLEICRSYQNRITWIVEKDNGIYDAFEKGLHHASGKWLYFMGADDRWNSDVYPQIKMNLMHAHQDLLLFDVVNEEAKSKWIPKNVSSSWSRTLYFKNTVHQQGCFYQKKQILLLGFNTKLKVLADYQLHLQLFQSHASVQKLPLVIATCHAQGISKQFTNSLYWEEWCMKKILPLGWRIVNLPWIIFKWALKTTTGKGVFLLLKAVMVLMLYLFW